jgi:quinol monooxygenase YgiN
MAPATAQDGGNLAAVTYWTIADGTTEDFEAGLKAHNQFHADQGDPNALLTWQAISGPRAGQYGRGSFGHEWADFDQDEEFLAADTADSEANVTPYIAAAESTTWAAMTTVSNPAAAPGNVSRIYEFLVYPGKRAAFEAAVSKLHEALSAQESWPHYEWYTLVDGGRMPTYAVVLPRENWAGFAPGDMTLVEAMSEKYGDEAGKIMQSFGEATEAQTGYTLVFRPDLSYIPAGEGE